MNDICFVKKKVNLLVEKCNCDTWNWCKEEHDVQNTAYLWNKINLSLEACFLFFSNNSGFVCMRACVCLCACAVSLTVCICEISVKKICSADRNVILYILSLAIRIWPERTLVNEYQHTEGSFWLSLLLPFTWPWNRSMAPSSGHETKRLNLLTTVSK